MLYRSSYLAKMVHSVSKASGVMVWGRGHQADTSQSRSKINHVWQGQEVEKEVSFPSCGRQVATNQAILTLALLGRGERYVKIGSDGGGVCHFLPKAAEPQSWETERSEATEAEQKQKARKD